MARHYIRFDANKWMSAFVVVDHDDQDEAIKIAQQMLDKGEVTWSPVDEDSDQDELLNEEDPAIADAKEAEGYELTPAPGVDLDEEIEEDD